MSTTIGLIAETIYKELLKKGFSHLQKKLVEASDKKDIYNFQSSQKDLEIVFSGHIKRTAKWAQLLEGLNLEERNLVELNYIDLEYYNTPLENQFHEQPKEKSLINTVFEKTRKHIAILGDAGMGKTSSMKMIALKLFTEEKYLTNYNFPLLVLCRDLYVYENDYAITRYLQHELGFSIKLTTIKSEHINESSLSNPERFEASFWRYIDSLKCLLILDGFDEIPITQQRNVYREIEEMSLHLEHSKIIVTSRTPNFKYHPSNIHIFEIARFSYSQIFEFSIKWLGKEIGTDFYNEIMNSTFSDVTGKPLILGYLVNLYSINKKIPEFPLSLYQQIIDILLNKWDKGRGLVRHSKFSNFDYDNKFILLSHISFQLLSLGKVGFNKNDLINVYNDVKIFFPLLPNNAAEVIDEVREHSGLIVLSGYDNYQFSHKSLQEYFAGHFIAKSNPIDEILNKILQLPDETAIATIITTNPNAFLTKILERGRHNSNINRELFFSIYLNKLVLNKATFYTSERFGYEVIYTLHWLSYSQEVIEAGFKFSEIHGITESIQLLKPYYEIAKVKTENSKTPEYSLFYVKRRNLADVKTYQNSLCLPRYIIDKWQ